MTRELRRLLPRLDTTPLLPVLLQLLPRFPLLRPAVVLAPLELLLEEVVDLEEEIEEISTRWSAKLAGAVETRMEDKELNKISGTRCLTRTEATKECVSDFPLLFFLLRFTHLLLFALIETLQTQSLSILFKRS